MAINRNISLNHNTEATEFKRRKQIIGYAKVFLAAFISLCVILPIAIILLVQVFPDSERTIITYLGIPFSISGVLSIVPFFIINKAKMSGNLSLPETILKYRHYTGNLAEGKLYLSSQIFNSALVYSDNSTAAVLENEKRNTSAMLINQGRLTRPSRPNPKETAWLLYDTFLYPGKWETRHRYRSPPQYYTVLEIQLNRPVPQLIFDSKKAAGRQFERVYASSQKLSFDAFAEGVFTAYAPQNCEIETLSFITPEVSLAMLEMDDCDIEFIGSNLLCYTQMLPTWELESFKAKCLNLHGKVNDNLSPGRRQTTKISPWGYQLLKSSKDYLWAFITGSVLILSSWVLILLYLSTLVLAIFTFFFIPALIMTGVALKRAHNIIYQNRRIKAHLHQKPSQNDL